MKIRIVLLAVALATVGSGCLGSSSANNNAALIKIAPQVLEQTAGGRKTEFLVVLSDQADLTLADSFKTKREKGEYVYRALLEKAGSTQPAIIEWLSTRAIPHQSFYIVNAILVNASADVAAELAQREDVARIEANSLIANNPELPVAESSPRPRLMSVEGNLSFIHAPEVWSLGYTGQGIVVGAGDTGQRYDHQALRDHYRGFTGSSFNHDYNWHDSIHSPATGGDCGADSPVPCDDSGHGSHTIGTAVGDDGAGNQIGVAPGAKWIGCRNMDRGNGTPARYLECFQFFLAPYPVGGNPAQGDPSRAADVTTNSWGCPQSEGCSANTLLAGVAAQRSAGVLTVVSAGNSGPGCSTVSDPPAIYNQSYTVGAFSHVTGTIATFSSRGPVTADGSGRLKPDISAPGVSIRSSTNTAANAYASLSGTSMAAPHVAGAIALLLSARPDLRGRVDDIEGYLNETAVKVSAPTSCFDTGSVNGVYGNGRLDVRAAVELALVTISPTSVNVPAAGGAGSIEVVTAPGTSPSWRVVSSNPSVVITSAASGTGSGTVSFQVRENQDETPRVLTFRVARRTFTVFQEAAKHCTYLLSPTSRSFPAAGGSASFDVVTQADCPWSVSSNADWVMINSAASGSGPGTVNFTVAAGTGSKRKTKLPVLNAGKFVIKQRAN